MRKILALVSFRIFPAQMGGQKGIVSFYTHLSKHLDILLAVPKEKDSRPDPVHLPVLYSNKKIYLNYGRIGRLKKIATDTGRELIIAEHSYTGWIAWLLHKKTGLPFIIHSHNIEASRFQKMNYPWWRIYRYYEKWIHQKAEHNFFISEEDMQYAVSRYQLNPSRCSVVTYGVEEQKPITDRNTLRNILKLPKEQVILLFNGTLDYKPNYDAVLCLIQNIIPQLRDQLKPFTVLVTGSRAPVVLVQQMQACPEINYLGFVDDIELYYQSADLFLNPVDNDSGIKTKLVEAISQHCTSISTKAGANGMRKEFCGEKLVVVDDGNWEGFASAITENWTKERKETPQEFFNYYQWDNIAARAAQKIQALINEKPS